VRRLAFSPRWVGGLLFCIAAAVTCALLGRWQWDVAQAHRGTLQNTAYAFNWWLFSDLFLGFWVKALRDTVARDARAAASPPSIEPAAAAPLAAHARRAAPPRTREPAPEQPVVVPSADEDPEVAEWNAWLQEMNADPRR
jgi:DNA-binding transcriptional regulator of glucitol operon